MLAGDLDAAERQLRRAYDALDAVGEKYLLSTVAGYLAQTLVEREAIEDAEALVDRTRELATDGDVETQALWRYVRGRTLARRRAFDDAEAIAREALALLEPTDATMMKLDGAARPRRDPRRPPVAPTTRVRPTRPRAPSRSGRAVSSSSAPCSGTSSGVDTAPA